MSRAFGAILLTLGIALALVFFILPFNNQANVRGDFVLWFPGRPLDLDRVLYWSVPLSAIALFACGVGLLSRLQINRWVGVMVVIAGALPTAVSVYEITLTSPESVNNIGAGFWLTLVISILIFTVGVAMLAVTIFGRSASANT